MGLFGAYRRSACVTAVLLMAIVSTAGAVQQPAASASAQSPTRVTLTAGRSTVLATSFDVVRIAITDAAIADATVVQPREVLIDGKSVGTVSLIIWGASTREQYEIVVEPSIGNLQRQLRALFPNEDIRVGVSDEAVVLSGNVSDSAVALRATEVAQASSAKSKVVNMLRAPVADTSQQVLLQVRFAEVDRRAITELGANFIARTPTVAGRTTTQQFSAPVIDDGQPAPIVFSDFLNLFLFWRPEGIGTVIRALQSRGYYHSLAEPNLIAYNGQEASFLAGGEFPVPIVQGANNNVSVSYKEFGVRLKFTPRISGDQIRLKVRPEVSSIDYGNGVTLSGFRIPGLLSRWADTEVELRDGQSFAIAGLLNDIAQEDVAKMPVLGSLPIIGPLFKSRATRKEQTELLVLVTPRLVKPIDGIGPPIPPAVLPVDPTLFLPRPGPGTGNTGAPPAKKSGGGR